MSEAKKYAKVRCPICETSGNWKNVDQYRQKPSETHLCLTCGFVTYPDVLLDKPKLEDFYREEYRDAPGFNNLCTGERKLHYHSAFLTQHEGLFDGWKKRGLEKPVVCEIGAAFGMFLHWMRQAFPGAEIHGTELTKSYVRNAWHMYRVKLTDAIDTSKKYDLIASYKVAEHMPEFNKELDKYAGCLADQGHLYISVPTWFGVMNNFGLQGFSLEYYYHKNHINVWTRTLFETLLAKHGFEIVQKNHNYYDDTYLCRFNADVKSRAPKYEKPADIERRMEAIATASSAFDQGQYDKALAAYQNFPDAWSAFYEFARAKHHKNGFDWIFSNIIEKAIVACPHSAGVRIMAGDLCMRYDQWEKALKYFDEGLGMKPNDPALMMNIATCLREMGRRNPAGQAKLFGEAMKVVKMISVNSQQMKGDALTQMMDFGARIPTPFETPVQNPG